MSRPCRMVGPRPAKRIELTFTPAGPVRQNPLLPRIAFGEWTPLLPPPDLLLGWDELNQRVRYSNRTRDPRETEWFPLLASPNQLVGWEKLYGSVSYSNQTLETQAGAISYQITAKNVRVSARAKKVSGSQIALYFDSDGGWCGTYFNGGRSFDIGRGYDHGTTFVELARGDSPQSCDDFFDFEFSAIGDPLTLFVNGKPLLQARDASNMVRTVRVGGGGNGLFRDVEIFIPSEGPLVADNRKLAGQLDNPPALEALCTRLPAKTRATSRCRRNAEPAGPLCAKMVGRSGRPGQGH